MKKLVIVSLMAFSAYGADQPACDRSANQLSGLHRAADLSCAASNEVIDEDHGTETAEASVSTKENNDPKDPPEATLKKKFAFNKFIEKSYQDGKISKSDYDKLSANTDAVIDEISHGENKCRGILAKVEFSITSNNTRFQVGRFDSESNPKAKEDAASALAEANKDPSFVNCKNDHIDQQNKVTLTDVKYDSKLSAVRVEGNVFNDNSPKLTADGSKNAKEIADEIKAKLDEPEADGVFVKSKGVKHIQIYACASMVRNCAYKTKNGKKVDSWSPFCTSTFGKEEGADYPGEFRKGEKESFLELSKSRAHSIEVAMESLTGTSGSKVEFNEENPADPSDPFDNSKIDPAFKGTCGPPAKDTLWGQICNLDGEQSCVSGKLAKLRRQYADSCKKLKEYYSKPEVLRALEEKTGNEKSSINSFDDIYSHLKDSEKDFAPFRYFKVVPEIEKTLSYSHTEVKVKDHYMVSCQKLNYHCDTFEFDIHRRQKVTENDHDVVKVCGKGQK